MFQSGGCLPPFAAVVGKRYKTMLWRGELSSEHVNISTKELVWIVRIKICAIGKRNHHCLLNIVIVQGKKISILKKASILEFVMYTWALSIRPNFPV